MTKDEAANYPPNKPCYYTGNTKRLQNTRLFIVKVIGRKHAEVALSPYLKDNQYNSTVRLENLITEEQWHEQRGCAKSNERDLTGSDYVQNHHPPEKITDESPHLPHLPIPNSPFPIPN
ncbi:hypothetical protein I8748_22880 [Nostoc sp. CENA67]|uniref:Uncharacterized protein n=1 Tax=Amazonocrinis nigriterrae CENA67 TaxID=2794033 RepID=A0A8J7HX81_9NOST|nr:hypothetical protein [Amazonocrinis nigriterrae]MBH8564992.1 hypothetical protein [Amazonocrinis nigriterrae CENA67]